MKKNQAVKMGSGLKVEPKEKKEAPVRKEECRENEAYREFGVQEKATSKGPSVLVDPYFTEEKRIYWASVEAEAEAAAKARKRKDEDLEKERKDREAAYAEWKRGEPERERKRMQAELEEEKKDPRQARANARIRGMEEREKEASEVAKNWDFSKVRMVKYYSSNTVNIGTWNQPQYITQHNQGEYDANAHEGLMKKASALFAPVRNLMHGLTVKDTFEQKIGVSFLRSLLCNLRLLENAMLLGMGQYKTWAQLTAFNVLSHMAYVEWIQDSDSWIAPYWKGATGFINGLFCQLGFARSAPSLELCTINKESVIANGIFGSIWGAFGALFF